MLTYSATLDLPDETATLLVEPLAAERLRRGAGIGARAASCGTQAVLVLRWFREDTGMPTLARDAGVSPATGYPSLHEGIDVLAAQAADLHEVLQAGQAEGSTHVVLDGTLIATDRCRINKPDTSYDLWYSGKHPAPAAACRSTGIPAALRWPSATSRRVRPTTSPLPAPPAPSARCPPRPRCWGRHPWPTRATEGASASTRQPRAPTWPPARPAATGCPPGFARKQNAVSPCSRSGGRR